MFAYPRLNSSRQNLPRNWDRPAMTDAQVAQVRRLSAACEHATDWARDKLGSLQSWLQSGRDLTAAQSAFADKLVAEAEERAAAKAAPKAAPAPAAAPVATLAQAGVDGVRELFGKAMASGLKRPKVTVSVEIGDAPVTLRLSRAPDTGRNPGCIYVTDPTKVGQDGRDLYLGAINPTGGFQARREASPDHVAALLRFGQNPAATASAHGRRTGSCCFCSRDLTTAESLFVGYGDTCADRYGLPWGETEATAAAA